MEQTAASVTKQEAKSDVVNQEFFLSVSPHIKSPASTAMIMWAVNVALLPATIASIYYFGLPALITILLCLGASVGFEFLYQKAMKKPASISDGSAFLTGLLLALNLPSGTPWYIPVLGSFIAIVLTKQLFGGLGFNLFNPALLARAFLMMSFPKILTTWAPASAGFLPINGVTAATPLQLLKMEGYQGVLDAFGGQAHTYISLLIGNRAGSLGETCIAALILGGLFLIATGIISWHIPVAFLGTAGVIAWIFGSQGFFTGDPILHLLSGGIVLGSFFMATDYVTSPTSIKGKILFGAACGALTMLIRLKGGYPEGVMFSILIMNCFVPLIDRGMRPRIFGSMKKEKK